MSGSWEPNQHWSEFNWIQHYVDKGIGLMLRSLLGEFNRIQHFSVASVDPLGSSCLSKLLNYRRGTRTVGNARVPGGVSPARHLVEQVERGRGGGRRRWGSWRRRGSAAVERQRRPTARRPRAVLRQFGVVFFFFLLLSHTNHVTPDWWTPAIFPRRNQFQFWVDAIYL